MGREREPAEEVGLDLLQDSIVLALRDGQVGHDLGKPPAIWRSLGPPIGDRLSELPQLGIGFRNEMQHFREPSTSLKPQVKSLVPSQHVIES